MNIAGILERAAAAYAESPALVQGDRVLYSYTELLQRVKRLAGFFCSSGLEAGDKVALFMENRPEYVEIMFATWYAGLVVVPVNAKLHGKEFLYIVNSSDTRAAFVSDKTAGALSQVDTSSDCRFLNVDTPEYEGCFQRQPRQHLASCRLDDLAWLFYTSGTTGQPKGAMQSHRNLFSMLNGFLTQVQAVEVGEAVYHGAPMSHGGGYYMLPFVAKGGYQLIPESGGFDVPELIELLEENRAVSFFAAPTMVKRLVDQADAMGPDALSGLHTIIYGGGPMYRTDLDQAHDLLGHRLAQIYGQGECPMTITVLDRYQHQLADDPRYQHRLNSVGQPHFGIELKVVDDQGKVLSSGDVGEILVRGEAVMLGYHRNPEATAASIESGWLHTGDVGYLDADGFLYLTDRSKDVIISGGSNIYPREVEEVLLQHPAVSEVSVFGIPDEDWGEIVVAAVRPDTAQSASHDDLDVFCVDQMARFKRPKHYLFFDELPKNATGKTLKTELRKQCEQILSKS